MAQVAENTGTAAARYKAMESDRESYLDRARRIARLTVTSLFREEGDTGHTDHVLPWQSAGTYFLNNLTNKARLSLFLPETMDQAGA